MLSEQENIERIKAKVNSLLANSCKEVFVIIDGDRTLIPTDSTKYFFQFLSLEYSDIKSIFKEHGYTFEAFHRVALFYSNIERERYNLACVESSKCVNIYPDFISFIDAIKDKVELILVTSGLSLSWHNIINNHSVGFINLIGGNYFPSDSFVVDKKAKGIIAREIKNANKVVFAFGDTMIDFEMLKEANNSYLVVNEKLNVDFVPFAKEIPHLKQVSFSNHIHQDIPTTDLKQIEQQILSL